MWRIMVLSVTALMFACSVKEVPQRRGPFAFHYGSSLTKEGLTWYSQFDLLVTHDPLPRDQVDQLHAAGTKVLLYEWAVAFYDSRATDWQQSLVSNRNVDLLNQTPLTGATGSPTSGAWYYGSELVRAIARPGDQTLGQIPIGIRKVVLRASIPLIREDNSLQEFFAKLVEKTGEREIVWSVRMASLVFFPRVRVNILDSRRIEKNPVVATILDATRDLGGAANLVLLRSGIERR